jgi:hypothetical protein
VNDSGPQAATNVAVSDLVPPGLALVSTTSSQGSYDFSTGTWTLGTLAIVAADVGDQVRVVSPSVMTNTAAIHADQADRTPATTSASRSLRTKARAS